MFPYFNLIKCKINISHLPASALNLHCELAMHLSEIRYAKFIVHFLGYRKAMYSAMLCNHNTQAHTSSVFRKWTTKDMAIESLIIPFFFQNSNKTNVL